MCFDRLVRHRVLTTTMFVCASAQSKCTSFCILYLEEDECYDFDECTTGCDSVLESTVALTTTRITMIGSQELLLCGE